MGTLGLAGGILLILFTLWDAFETVVMPRTFVSAFRLSRYYIRASSVVWFWLVKKIRGGIREAMLGMFGPLSMLILPLFWALGLLLGFSLIQWGLDHYWLLHPPSLAMDILNSASCMVTLGLERSTHELWTKITSVLTAAMGLGFLALVIGYLPTLYQAFSSRETFITLLDARTGSPPVGALLIRRYTDADQLEGLTSLLSEAERWAATLLESHLSYPALTSYRSQHGCASWLTALTTIMDASVLLIVGMEETSPSQTQLTWQAGMTFAMARHAVLDLAQVIVRERVIPLNTDRLTGADYTVLAAMLKSSGIDLSSHEKRARLNRLRLEYEPVVNSIAQILALEVPLWLPSDGTYRALEPDSYPVSD